LIENAAKALIQGSTRLEGIALCGTLPPGLPGTIYSTIAKMKPKGSIVLLDAYQNIEVLSTGKVDILKINCEEAKKMASLDDDDDVLDAAASILSTHNLKILAITDGPSEYILLI
jgi:fructose-1-phosphate kinase PfkB-like protein